MSDMPTMMDTLEVFQSYIREIYIDFSLSIYFEARRNPSLKGKAHVIAFAWECFIENHPVRVTKLHRYERVYYANRR